MKNGRFTAKDIMKLSHDRSLVDELNAILEEEERKSIKLYGHFINGIAVDEWVKKPLRSKQADDHIATLWRIRKLKKK